MRQPKSELSETPYLYAVMVDRSEAYRRRADDCDAAAERVSNPAVRTVYVTIGARWRKMAEQQQAIEDFLRERGQLPE